MPQTHPPLGILLMTSQRDYLLPVIIEQIREEFPHHFIILNTDRPSAGVAKMALRYNRSSDVVVTSFGPVVSDDGERFPQVRNQMLEALRRFYDPAYVMVWDDDQIWSRCAELRSFMRLGVDVIEAQDLFFWDSPDTYAIHGFLRHHWSPQIFKNDNDDRFDESLIQQATAKISKSLFKRQARAKLLNYGLITAAERQRVFETYKRAGKIDEFTTSFVSPPILKTYKPWSDEKWFHRAAEHLRQRGIFESGSD